MAAGTVGSGHRALFMVGGITAGQYFGYDSGIRSHLMLALKVGVIVFAVGSEVFQTMEREAATVRYRSENSSVFKATVGAIQNATSAPVPVASAGLAEAQADAARAQVEIDACERHRPRGQARVDQCLRIERGNLAAAQARITAIQSATQSAAQANQNTALAMVAQAKALQFDEQQHFQGIQFLSQTLAISAIAATFLFAFGIIGTFEAMFFLLGKLRGETGRALKAYGLTVRGGLIRDEYRDLGLTDDDDAQPTPAPAPAAPQAPRPPHNGYQPDPTLQAGFAPTSAFAPVLTTFNHHIRQNHPAPGAATVADWLSGHLKTAPGPGTPPPVSSLSGASTWNAELSKSGIDSPADAAMNQAADKAQIDRIIRRGQQSGSTPHSDLTRQRFFKLLYTDIRQKILNGELKPTVRPVTAAVTALIHDKGRLLNLDPDALSKPERQQLAQAILDNLEQESVLMRNQDGGVGKPRYVLAPRYQSALHPQQTGQTGSAEHQFDMPLATVSKPSAEGHDQTVSKPSAEGHDQTVSKPSAEGHDQTVSKPSAEGHAGLYGQW
ncbi:MAG: hypothetical protein R3E89_04635 [Thiolinea sp.]